MLLLFLVIGFAAICLWYVRDNRHLKAQWQQNTDAQVAKWISHFAWSRTAQTLLAVACLMLIIAVYDSQLKEARESIAALNTSLAENSKKLADLQAAAAKNPSVVYYPPASATSTQLPAPAEKPAATKTDDDKKLTNIVSPGETVEDIYNPEKNSPDKQSGMDDIKKRYEEILVTYMFLKKCGIATAEDFHIITSALAQEMASINAPGRLQYDILTSAQGSYKEMYSQNSCDAKGVDALESQFKDYVKVLSTNFPAL